MKTIFFVNHIGSKQCLGNIVLAQPFTFRSVIACFQKGCDSAVLAIERGIDFAPRNKGRGIKPAAQPYCCRSPLQVIAAGL